ncbi:MAG: hypothetical protein WB820_00305, partial [Rhodoplanes sp.]
RSSISMAVGLTKFRPDALALGGGGQRFNAECGSSNVTAQDHVPAPSSVRASSRSLLDGATR